MTTYQYFVSAARRAIARAYEGNCHQRFEMFESEPGAAEGLYRSESGELYFVTLAACSCKGSRYGCLCRHQLALADLTGQLDLFIPEAYAVERIAA